MTGTTPPLLDDKYEVVDSLIRVEPKLSQEETVRKWAEDQALINERKKYKTHSFYDEVLPTPLLIFATTVTILCMVVSVAAMIIVLI